MRVGQKNNLMVKLFSLKTNKQILIIIFTGNYDDIF